MKVPKIVGYFSVVLGLFVVTTAHAADNVVVTEKARVHFRAGVAYIDDPSGPKYEEAYREFHRAYAESPTYKIMTNIGLCALNLERDGEAIESYERFLASAKPDDIPQNKRTLMERDIAMLKASLVTVSVSGSPTNVVIHDERIPSKGSAIINRYELQNGKLEIGIHPGHHRMTASAEGWVPQTWDFEADSGSNHRHEFVLKPSARPTDEKAAQTPARQLDAKSPPSTDRRSTPTWVYVGAAATGVFAVTATVSGLLARSKMNEFDKVNSTGTDPVQAREIEDSGKRLALVTDISIAAAVLAGAGTAIGYFASKPSSHQAADTRRWRFAPIVGGSSANLMISGQF